MSGESDAFVDVTYRGLKVAHKARFRGEANGGFVELEAPLPVGSMVQIVSGEGAAGKDARVVGVVEHEAGAKSPPGMRVSWGAVATTATPATVAPREVAEAAVVQAVDDNDTAQNSGGVDATTGEKKKKGGKKKNGR